MQRRVYSTKIVNTKTETKLYITVNLQRLVSTKTKEEKRNWEVNQPSVVAKNVCLTAGKFSLKHFQDLCFLKSLLE